MRPEVVDDRYVLSELLGSGGTARVYRAHDRILRREVAVKVLREQYAEDAAFVERFLQEAKSAAALVHQRVVGVYDQGRTDDGGHYTVMEYLPGGSLRDRLLAEDGPLPPRMAAGIAAQIAEALGAAHEAGMVHRDIKPQNILLTEDGEEVKVADFGIARAEAATTISGAGTVLGTAAYMSPEQAAGESVDGHSDLYSLGVVLYEMLTGELPFEADTPIGVAMKHLHSAPRHPRELNSGLPEGMDDLTARLLTKDPAHRYQRASELAADLWRARDGIHPVNNTVGFADRGGRRSGRHLLHRRLSTVTALFALFLVLTATLAMVFGPLGAFEDWEPPQQSMEEQEAAAAGDESASPEKPRAEEAPSAAGPPRHQGGPDPTETAPKSASAEGTIAESAKVEGSAPEQHPASSSEAEANTVATSAPGPAPTASGPRTSATPSSGYGVEGGLAAGATPASPSSSWQSPDTETPPGPLEPPMVEPSPAEFPAGSSPPVSPQPPAAFAESPLSAPTEEPTAAQPQSVQQSVPSPQESSPRFRSVNPDARQAPPTHSPGQQRYVASEPAPSPTVPRDRRESPSPEPTEQEQSPSPTDSATPKPVAPEKPEPPEQPEIPEPVAPEPPEKPQPPTFAR